MIAARTIPSPDVPTSSLSALNACKYHFKSLICHLQQAKYPVYLQDQASSSTFLQPAIPETSVIAHDKSSCNNLHQHWVSKFCCNIKSPASVYRETRHHICFIACHSFKVSGPKAENISNPSGRNTRRHSHKDSISTCQGTRRFANNKSTE